MCGQKCHEMASIRRSKFQISIVVFLYINLIITIVYPVTIQIISAAIIKTRNTSLQVVEGVGLENGSPEGSLWWCADMGGYRATACTCGAIEQISKVLTFKQNLK